VLGHFRLRAQVASLGIPLGGSEHTRLGCACALPQGLAHENQRLQSTVTQLQRELAARDSELAIRADEIASLREAQRSAQSQINQYIADLQASARAACSGVGNEGHSHQ
jgi:hypothetical protein